ncbi:Gfo/Idh/MocA family protein [Actinoplanes xinjiangensis]|uniref:Oxidoreductase family protein n=1 Tax=Actinoplanes xinjiangensis TaxID=512350 RepID=A0A316FIE5_9ACTN|nr:Gfo/Idh/MocA family oxidoreductase [Actinoplanes xinjiangensis]PWK47496.1 oxidoreductase family protein [Actinoplanes xinjiangensis]GIF39575.1 dehydrogenase [Actinoplanes xinjiangensis]
MTRRHAVVGLGHRAQLYIDALLGEWSDTGEIVAFCDPNQTRMAYHNDRIAAAGRAPVPTFHPDRYAEVLALADAVIITTVDARHADHVCAALDAGVDVIVEKPLTVDAESCARIAAAAERSAARLIVTFNYRYSPRNSAVRRLLAEGRIGRVTSVHFEWLLDTIHGADYFRRWHRVKANSGGLLVHKSTHHFDLVNWWLGSSPETVFAQTGLRFYGPSGAGAGAGVAAAGLPRSARAHGAPGLGTDPFLLDITADPRLKALYLDAEHEDGYLRDRDVFSEGIDIDDTMSVLIRYADRTTLTYSLTAYSPWEGYRVAFNGTRGRLELEVCERAWTPAHGAIDPSALDDTGGFERLTVQEHWQKAEEVPIVNGAGGHGGGDKLLLDDVFRGAGDDPLARQAGYRDGIRSVLTGVAADRSARTGLPVSLSELM